MKHAQRLYDNALELLEHGDVKAAGAQLRCAEDSTLVR